MKKQLFEILMWLPFVFFIFLASFLVTKFIFIFFLNAAFTPLFIFELTPLFLLPGMNYLQLLFISLLIVLMDAYLHTTDKSKHLRYSFIPTWIIISGVGVAIVKQPGSLDYGIRYILFAFLLIVTLIDHRMLLVMPEKMLDRKSFIAPSMVSPEISPGAKTPFYYSKTTLQKKPIPTMGTQSKSSVFFIGNILRNITKNIHLPKKIFKSKPYYDTRDLEKYDVGGKMGESVKSKLTPIKEKKIVQSVEARKSKEKDTINQIRNKLVIGISKDGEIIQFNKECQIITGYTRGEVLRKKIFDLLIPKHSFQQWEKMFDLAVTKGVDDFKLPWKTRDGKEILISWSSFPLETKEGLIKSICFIGKNLGINTYEKFSYESQGGKLDTEIKPQESEGVIEGANNYFDSSNGVIFTEVEKPIMSESSESSEISEKLNDLRIKYDMINRKIKAIESQTDKPLSNLKDTFMDIDKEGEYKLKLAEDRKNLDKRIAEFGKYKEKLIELETEIEKRRNNVIEHEKSLRENILAKNSSLTKDANINLEETPNFDEILQSAAIIRRGILKQINRSFAELVGFKTDEILNRDFLDLVAPEGLANIEQYYLNRLKGIGDSTYNTIFSTKNKDKISVRINIKPTYYKGEKAEIATVNKIENKQK